MALLGKRYEFQTDVSFFMNEVAERGGCVSFSTGNPSGEAMDSSTNVVDLCTQTLRAKFRLVFC